jgi:putative ATP-binding cassette transporter
VAQILGADSCLLVVGGKSLGTPAAARYHCADARHGIHECPDQPLAEPVFQLPSGSNQSQFYRQLLRFVGLAGVWVVMSVYAQYLTQVLQIRWRRWLTEEYLGQWLADRAYYRMQFAGTQTDNPDQRIAEDLKLFVEGSVTLFVGLLNAAVTLVSFIGILWMLSGR